MSAPAWMPLYVADYLGDTGHLSTIEHGAYMLMIMHYWQNRCLPKSDAKLARVCRLSDDEFASIRPTLAELFDEDWTHARIDAELTKADETIAKRSAAGRTAASVRHAKRTTNAVQTDTQPPSPSPTPEGSLRSPSARADEKPPSAKAEANQIERELREAAGLENDPSPSLFDLSPILALIAKGYTLSGDILPKLREAKARNKRGRTWAYYVAAITERHDANAAIAAKPQAQASDPVVWILEDDPRWRSAAERYQVIHGKRPHAAGSRHETGIGFHFPAAMIAAADPDGTFSKLNGKVG